MNQWDGVIEFEYWKFEYSLEFQQTVKMKFKKPTAEIIAPLSSPGWLSEKYGTVCLTLSLSEPWQFVVVYNKEDRLAIREIVEDEEKVRWRLRNHMVQGFRRS